MSKVVPSPFSNVIVASAIEAVTKAISALPKRTQSEGVSQLVIVVPLNA